MIIHKNTLGNILAQLQECANDPEFKQFDSQKLLNSIACIQISPDESDNSINLIQSTKFIEKEDGTCYVIFTPYAPKELKL